MVLKRFEFQCKIQKVKVSTVCTIWHLTISVLNLLHAHSNITMHILWTVLSTFFMALGRISW